MTNRSGYTSKQIGNYRIVAEISSGSYGIVYQGRHIIFEDDPVVAIKLLHAHLGSSQEHEQFIQEARLLRKLKHPHILPILDAGTQDNIPYLVMQYASGGSLKDRQKHQSSLSFPLEEALKILSQIGQALNYAHQQNIVHRDLKPANILFNAQGDALLADFGIARMLPSANSRLFDITGTPEYMAPEQFEGIVSIKSDQYALGCIAYELLTGQKTFTIPPDAIKLLAWGYHHRTKDPVPLTQLNPLLPVYIEQAVLKLCPLQQRPGPPRP